MSDDFNLSDYVGNAHRPPLLDLLWKRSRIRIESPDFLIPLRRGVEIEGHAQIFMMSCRVGFGALTEDTIEDRRRHALGALYRMVEIELIHGKPHSLPRGGTLVRRTAGVLWLGALGPYDPTKLALAVMRPMIHTTVDQDGCAYFLIEAGLTLTP